MSKEQQLKGFKDILKSLDLHMEKATAVYSKILNSEGLRKDQELLDKAFEACDEIQKSRMECQNQIMLLIMQINTCEETESIREAGLMSEQDYNEYNYNRSIDSQADEMDAISSVFGGEE